MGFIPRYFDLAKVVNKFSAAKSKKSNNNIRQNKLSMIFFLEGDKRTCNTHLE